jgi:hypothetical protein
MVRALTSQRAGKSQKSVLVPGATEAEPWELWTVGADARCVASSKRADEAPSNRNTVLALPVTQVIALPLWLQETDEREFRDVIALQLETRALSPRTAEPVFAWSLVQKEPTRTLVLVAVLPASLPEELETDAYAVFEISARCYAMPADALVLWAEKNRLVLAVTRQDRLIHFQALSDSRITARTIQTIVCTIGSLQIQGVIDGIRQVVSWAGLSPAESSALQAGLGVPVQAEDRPAPSLPGEGWNLTPPKVGEVKRLRQSRRWKIRAAILAALALLVALAGFGLHLFVTAREVSQLRAWQEAHASDLQTVQDTSSAWQDLQPVVDKDNYPLEVLLHVSDALPADQVHLTLFEQEGTHLLIKAEAKNLTAGFQFFDRLKKDPSLSSYTWEMAQPQSLANDITQLQIEGTYAAHE